MLVTPVSGSVTSIETVPSLTIGTQGYVGELSTGTTFFAWIEAIDSSLSPRWLEP